MAIPTTIIMSVFHLDTLHPALSCGLLSSCGANENSRWRATEGARRPPLRASLEEKSWAVVKRRERKARREEEAEDRSGEEVHLLQ